MKVLVTGGSGYIGSFMTKALLDKGHEVTVFDNLGRGHREAVNFRAKFIKGDITNEQDLESLFANEFDAAMHFAGLIAVGESEQNRELYYRNNVEGSRLFFEKSIKSGLVKFIFSSSAAVYGNPIKLPIPEDHPKNPTSEYGKNKLEAEDYLTKLRNENPNVSFACLRYFNAAGASLDGSLGEAHIPETHIIPKILESIISGADFRLFGDDYKTADGTCIRDYIHVLDLVEAHFLALEFIQKNPGGYFFNVGTGKGYSNKEVVEEVERITAEKIKVEVALRRKGDSDELVADPAKIKRELGFFPKYSDLPTIIKTAWSWHQRKSEKE